MRLYFVSFFILISTLAFATKNVKASYYHSKFEGRTTSSGSKYRADSLTCAHRTLPFGTRLKVENPENNNFVIVVVTDRGPFIRGREIDLSYIAAERLDIINQGVAEVTLTLLRELKLTPPISFDKKGMFLVEKEPHSAYDNYDLGKEKVLYTQR
ncbi:MAG: septal ring lytic transglycosylase RlpA family protein [Dysgonamonadaceae bacterium]|nr:septal ring lytic transglycosylase RlpA family protein [Dysgonamonadaceae bacterium]MDD4729243.1 septal ring lytic transglycosylase RlpA family protein [Dysgonamonadaceae bacterium]